MVNVVGSKDDPARWKPAGFEKHLTVGQVCAIVKRDRSRILSLEREGRLPKPIRVKVGKLRVRLYSPEQVKVIVTHFKNAKPGNPGHKNKEVRRVSKASK